MTHTSNLPWVAETFSSVLGFISACLITFSCGRQAVYNTGDHPKNTAPHLTTKKQRKGVKES
jgi:hypothetical protein